MGSEKAMPEWLTNPKPARPDELLQVEMELRIAQAAMHPLHSAMVNWLVWQVRFFRDTPELVDHWVKMEYGYGGIRDLHEEAKDAQAEADYQASRADEAEEQARANYEDAEGLAEEVEGLRAELAGLHAALSELQSREN